MQAKYTYPSDGTKVSAFDASGAGLVYRGPFTYRRSSGGTLAFESAPFDSGRLTEAGARYHVTDHLGSMRAVIDGNASTTTYPLTGFYSVDDFAPFGTKSASSASSYLSLASTGSTVSLRDGFTGQEDQFPDFGVGYSDFGARQYSPALSRWLVPDPMGEKYYDVSPYAYCAGNPINRIDPNGNEWLERGNVISVLLNIYSDGIDSEQIELYKQTIAEMFNEMITTVSEGLFSGEILFFENNNSLEQSLGLFSFHDSSLGGSTSRMSSLVNPYDKNGVLLPTEVVAQSAIHEILHTVRLDHPFETTQSWDTQLIRIGPNEYKSTFLTDPNIVNNIMYYSSISIDGMYGNDMRYLTKGQFEFIRREIYLQNKGLGVFDPGSPMSDESLIKYFQRYEDYWNNIPGIPVL